MAINVFDAKGTFSADTSELDQFVLKLEQGLTTASEKAAAGTTALSSATKEFRAALAAAAVEGGNTVDNMTRLADAEKSLALAAAASRQEHAALKTSLADAGVEASRFEGKMSEARGAIALLGEEVGVHVPRHVATFIARLPGVQAALAAGFAPVAIFAIIEIVSKLSEKISEVIHQAEEVETAFQKMQDDATTSFGHIGDSILEIEKQIDELNHNYIGALQKQLELLDHATLNDLQKEMQAVGKNTDDVFSKMKSWVDFLVTSGLGNDSIEKAKTGLDEIVTNYDKFLKSGDKLDAFAALQSAIDNTQAKVVELTKEQAEATAEFNEAAKLGLEADTAHAAAVETALSAYQKQLVALQNILKIQQARTEEEQKQDQLANQQTSEKLLSQAQQLADARVGAEKTMADSLVAVHLQLARSLLGADQDNYSNELKIQAQSNAEKYDNEKKALNDRLELALSQGEKGRAQSIAIEAQIAALENKHRADELKAWNDFQRELYLIMSQPIPLVNELPPGMDTISNEVTKAFDQAKAAAQALGITLRSDLDSSLSDAFQHYDKLTQLLKQGVVTQRDVNNGYIALIKQELDFAKATGATTEAVQKLEKELARLTGQDGAHVDAFGRRAHLTLQNFKTDLHSGVDGIKELEDMGRQAFEDLTQGLENAVAAAIMGADGFGKALEKATAEALSSLAAQALVKALFYTAEGFAALAGFAEYSASQYFTAAGIMAGVGAATGVAGHALAGAADSGSSSAATGGTSGPASNSPNVNAGSGPSQVVNVTHFADGGIATQPMLGMLAEGGKASEEAIIPLHDQNAIGKIAAAFMEPIQRLAHMSPNLSIPASLLYPGSSGSVSRGNSQGGFTKQDVQSLIHAITSTRPELGHLEITLQSDIDQVVKTINHRVSTGRTRLLASNSIRLTRRS